MAPYLPPLYGGPIRLIGQPLEPGTVLNGLYEVRELLPAETDHRVLAYLAARGNELCVIHELYPNDFRRRPGSRELDVSGDSFPQAREIFLKNSDAVITFQPGPRVLDRFEESNTAYIVTEYIQEPPPEPGPGNILLHDMDCPWAQNTMFWLGLLHRKGLIHGRIIPEVFHRIPNPWTFFLRLSGVDFGQGIGLGRSAITVHQGFAPIELYMESGKPGPWTDVYSLAAVMYYFMTSQVPPSSVERLIVDTLPPPRQLGAQMTEAQEQAMLKALAPKPENRFQTMGEFSDALYGATEREAKRRDELQQQRNRELQEEVRRLVREHSKNQEQQNISDPASGMDIQKKPGFFGKFFH